MAATLQRESFMTKSGAEHATTTPTDDQVFAALESFFSRERKGREGGVTITPDTDIIAQGLVDSLGIFKLIAFVEETFAVTIEPDEVLLENFQTLRALKQLIVTKLGNTMHKQAAR
jgi:acyl carrier protein